MPMDLQASVTLVANTAFRNRVAMAFYLVARGVLSESGDVTGHEVRRNFALSVTRQDHTAFLQYAALVVADPTIRSGSYTVASPPSDDQIQAAVNVMWNWLAGIPDAFPT